MSVLLLVFGPSIIMIVALLILLIGESWDRESDQWP